MTLDESEKEYPPIVEVFKVVMQDGGANKVAPPRTQLRIPNINGQKFALVTLRVRYAYWIIDPVTCMPFSCDEFLTKNIMCIDELDGLVVAMQFYCGPENLIKLKHDLIRLRNNKLQTMKRNTVTPPTYSTLFKTKRKVRR